MAPTLLALLGFSAWTLLLVLVTFLYRSAVVLTGRRRANAWPRGETPDDEPAPMARLRDAHLNCAENLPLFAALSLVAYATDSFAITDPVAPYVLAARLAQSLTHLSGTSHAHVFVRANFFFVQLALYAYMAYAMFSALSA